MQKKYFTALCLALFIVYANAQLPTMLWQHGWGNAEYDVQPSLTTDAENNIYVTGYFKGTLDFDPGPGTAILNAGFLTHTYIVKFNANGEFQWVKEIGNEIH